jgi:hypothetical protein
VKDDRSVQFSLRDKSRQKQDAATLSLGEIAS